MTYIQDIAKHEGQTVTIRGWLHNRRSSGKIHFLQVRDGSGFIQAVMSKAAVGEELFKAGRSPVAGDLARRHRHRARRHARAGRLRARRHRARRSISEAHDFPITPKEHGVDFLLDRRHLWIRSPRQQAILRVRHEVINAVRDYFNERDFILADTPIFTPAACEGTTTLFPVQYFEDTTAYLTQSGQLYNEANAMALGRVYCFGPDVPRREVEDAPPSHRVLDGRAGSGVRHARRRHRAGGRAGRARRRARARSPAAGAEDARAQHVEARDR